MTTTATKSKKLPKLKDSTYTLKPVTTATTAAPAATPTKGTTMHAPTVSPTPGVTLAKGSIIGVQPPIPETVCPTLTSILSQKRQHNTSGELAFLTWLGDELKSMGHEFERKAGGNVLVRVLAADGRQSDVLFSCHVDTVHSEQGGKQALDYDANFGHITLRRVPALADTTNAPGVQTNKTWRAGPVPDKDGMVPSGSCLGADDGAGIWIMLQMIKAKKPGTYIFHRGEERGGIGANEMLRTEKDFLEQFNIAVAFDRPRTNEVITHQGGQECASKVCGQALVEALNQSPYLDYKVSTNGVFTDTKVYRRVISECFNIGVGYERQHGPGEWLDYAHLVALKDQCIQIDWEALPVDRNPAAPDPVESWRSNYPTGGYHGYQGAQRGFDWDDEPGWGASSHAPKKPAAVPAKTAAPVVPDMDLTDELRGLTLGEIDEVLTNALNDGDGLVWAEALRDLCMEVVSLRAQVKFLKG